MPVSQWHEVQLVAGLQKGRTTAREPAPVEPVAESVVEATLPHLPSILQDMICLQRATGMRPGEVCIVRPCDLDRTGEVWTFKPHRHKLEHKGLDRTVYIGPAGQAVLLSAKLWDLNSGQELGTLPGEDDWVRWVRSVAFFPDGKTLISADTDGNVNLWDVERKSLKRRLPIAHGHELRDLALAPAGTHFATAGAGARLLTWKLEDLEPILVRRGLWGDGFTYIPLTVHDDQIVVGNNKRLQLWKLPALDLVAEAREEPRGWRIAAYTPSGRHVVVAQGEEDKSNSQIELRDARDLSLVRKTNLTNPISCFAIHPNGKFLIASGLDGDLYVVDVETLTLRSTVASNHRSITTMAFSPDGSTLCTSGPGDAHRIWSVDQLQVRASYDGRGGGAFSSDGKLLALGSNEPLVRLLQLPRLEELRPLVGHHRVVQFHAFAPQQHLLASVDASGVVKLWDVAIGEELMSVETGKDFHDLVFAPDGKSVIGACGDSKDVSDWGLWVWRSE